MFVAAYAVVFTVGSVLLDRRRPTCLRLGDDGIVLAGARRDGVFVPRCVIGSARVRGFWPIATLEVTVPAADAPQVPPRLARGGRKPIRRRRGDRIRLVVPLAGLRASPATISADLRARGLPHP